MRAWEDLVSKDKLCHTSVSDWYIDHGVKIERFHDDGRIEIRNMMTSRDRFEDVSPKIFNHFDQDGWISGCMHLNIEVCQYKIFNINNLIRTYIGSSNDIMVDTLSDKRIIIQKKINKCRDRLTKN